MLATVTGWWNKEKAAHLAVSLQGVPHTLLTNIFPGHHGDYVVLVTCLGQGISECPLNRVVFSATEESVAKEKKFTRISARS